MSQLLYHRLTRTSEDISPFDKAILQVIEDGTVRIVSPFIGVSYLERITDAVEEWLLISDIEAWLSTLSLQARPRAWEFIRENLSHIHHCEGIHAKAVIGEQFAMFGSANLTEMGILGRTELGILIDAPAQVHELQGWFDGLWSQTRSPYIDATNAFVRWLDDEARRTPTRRQSFSLAGESRIVRARLIETAQAPVRDYHPSSALNLSIVAHDLITRDRLHYESLDAAVAAAIEQLAGRGFKLGEAVLQVKSSYPYASTREVYFLLLQHCANHPRSVFSAGTINRLILTNGLFRQSDRESLLFVIARYDHYLANIFQYLSVHEPRDLPSETVLASKTGITERDQVLLISELLECGLLLLEDRPGEMACYWITEDFNWTGRFRLFNRARAAWQAATAAPRPPQRLPLDSAEVNISDFSENEDFSLDNLDYRSLQDHLNQSLKSKTQDTKKSKEKSRAPAVIDAQRMALMDERLMSLLLWITASPRTTTSRKALAIELITDLGIPKGEIELMLHGGRPRPKLVLLNRIPGQSLFSAELSPRITETDLDLFPKTRAAFRAQQGSARPDPSTSDQH